MSATPLSSSAMAGSEPNKTLPGAGLIYSIAQVQTPGRDVDLFGPVTVRIDGRPAPDAAPFPVLYLSAYVPDPMAFAARVAGALAWLDDTQAETARAVQTQPQSVEAAGCYTLPEFVEDVDWSETLFVAEQPEETDWKAWSAAMVRRVRLAVTASQIARLVAANTRGAGLCPPRHRAAYGKALLDAQDVTHDQAAGA